MHAYIMFKSLNKLPAVEVKIKSLWMGPNNSIPCHTEGVSNIYYNVYSFHEFDCILIN